MNLGIHEPDIMQPDEVHAVGNVRDSQAFECFENGAIFLERIALYLHVCRTCSRVLGFRRVDGGCGTQERDDKSVEDRRAMHY